jgi:hypothetical protein
MIYEPALDNLYQKAVLGIEERETKHLGIFISHPYGEVPSFGN